MKDLKLKLIENNREYLHTKQAVVKKAMRSLTEDLENESKSSAGDKYETGREMINIEWNKLSTQLHEYERLEKILDRINLQQISEKVILGSIVKTETANYFISIPSNSLEIEGKFYYSVGIQAPITRVLLGKVKDEVFTFNQKTLSIIDIL